MQPYIQPRQPLPLPLVEDGEIAADEEEGDEEGTFPDPARDGPRRPPTLSLAVTAVTAAKLPPLRYPVEPGSAAFKYEEGENHLLAKPGELVQARANLIQHGAEWC
eukprot:COSAG05_NODE_20_length_33177_cov_336.302639_25_plen_106_part_00